MDNASDFVLFMGRFHPLIVHLPIGFLIFAFILEIFSKWKQTPTLTSSIPFALLSGAISAAVACALGYMLSTSGDYDENTLNIHFWFGIATTAIAFLAWLIRIDKIKIAKIKPNISALALIVILISITGHYGGNLTHGSDYLTKYAPFGKEEKIVLVPVTKVEDAAVFDYLVHPILDKKCMGCHNPDKKKGGLSLVDSISILKGGKNGEVIVAGDATKSEMVKRVLLEPHDDDFMPPEGKTPLTEEEIAIITYWINDAHANFNVKVASIKTPENILGIASTMLGLEMAGKKGDNKLPKVNGVSNQILNELTKEGFVLKELVFDSGLYEVVLPPNTITASNANNLDGKIEKLSKIKDNIVWLYIEDNQLKDSHLKTINQFSNLQKLVINRNNITDAGIKELGDHKNINSLNIYKTSISKNSLDTFSKMTNLQHVYLWDTQVTKEDASGYKTENFPELVFGL